MPAEIYWRRRLLVLATIIALVWGVLQLTGGEDDSPTAKQQKPAPTKATPVATPANKLNGTVKVSLSTGSQACDPEKVRVTPTVRSGQVTKSPVTVGLVVSSSQRTACTLTPSAADLLVVISANKTAVWDSTVCKASLLREPVAISPRWATLVETTWSGRGSGSACSPKEGYASPGSYTIQAGTLGGEPGKASFTLKSKPTPKKSSSTQTPKPSKTTTEPADG